MSTKTRTTPVMGVLLSAVLLMALHSLGVTGQVTRPPKNLADPRLDCISRLRLPIYGPIAETVRGGIVETRITIGESGQPTNLDLRTSKPQLSGEVRIAMGDSEFNPACAGVDVQLRFVFRDKGLRSRGYPVWDTYFIPPNTFEVAGTHSPPAYDQARPLDRLDGP